VTSKYSNLSKIAFSSSVIALALAIAPAASAQILSGTVKDASGDARFEGALVTIEELGRTTSTNRFGEYRLTNIPAGDYTVTTEYVGTAAVRNTLNIPATGANLDIVIGEDVDYIDNIIVVGTRAAQAGSINQQRASGKIITVIDSDGLGNFPDTTVADVLQRASGISIETDQGEGRYVSIRGINPDLISTSINGVRTPSPEDRRGVLLDGIPSDLLNGIEIQKSLTPDVDADSIGGVINLKTLSAFDRDGQYLSLKGEGRINDITDNISGKGTVTYTNTWNDRLGLAVSANYQELAVEAHNNEAGGWGEQDGIFYINDDFENRWYDLTRKRLGLVGNIDFRASDTTDLYVRTLYNRYADDEVRNKFELRSFDDTFDDAFGNGDEDTELSNPLSSTQTQIALNEVDAEVRVREEIRQIQTYSVGGKTNLDTVSFDYEVAYAFAEEDDSDNHDVTFRAKDLQEDFGGTADAPLFVTLDTSNPQTPILNGSQELINAIYDPANYGLDVFEREFTTNQDTEWSGKFNVSKDVVYGETQIEWKAGAKYRDREKVRDVNLTFHEPDLDLSPFVDGQLLDGWRLGIAQPAWPDATLTTGIRSQLNDDDLAVEDTFIESALEDFTINEEILAGYVMGTFEKGPLTAIAGVRVEQTSVDMEGNIVEEEGDTGEPVASVVSFSDDYTHWLPSLNLKYQASERVIGRAAYYKAIVRPAFGEMAPFAIINDDRDEVELGNPLLKPYEADNFDLTFEFYPNELSLISVGGFYKEIKNAIFSAEVSQDQIFSGLVPTNLDDEAEFSSFINVDNSSIIGVEFNLVQDLAVLTPSLDGFIASGNITLSDSEATLPDGREVPFLRQSDVVWNAALAYDKGPWDLRVSANFRGDALDELIDEDLDRIQDDRLLIEASAKYNISDSLRIYVEGKNLTDAPEYYYFGDESRLSQYDEFGRSFIVGFKYTY